MAVKARSDITLALVVDVKAAYRYYLLQSSTLERPPKPDTNPPEGSWRLSEPLYEDNSTNSLYTVDLTVYRDDTFSYSEVSLSSSYEAAKQAWNKAQAAQQSADAAREYTDEIIIEKAAEIIDDAETITLEILDERMYTTEEQLDAYRIQIENTMIADREGFEFIFNQMKTDIDGVNDELSKQNEYIRLQGGNIVLGKSDSPVTAVFTNESLQFLYNGQPVATFTNKVLQVHNIEVEHQVRFGNDWAIRPGAAIAGHGQNLNIIWIGG